MKFKKLSEVKVKDKKVLLRIDINSPVINGKIEDNPRLQECAHTIKYLIKNKAKLVIIAHQGRKGDRDFVYLKQHASLLTKHSKIKITYIDSLFETTASRAIENLKSGSALLLKNVRSYDDELDINKKDNKFSEFSKQFDLFVNDAFSVCHRKQSSLMIPPKYITSCIGLALEKEISALDKFSIKNKPTLYLLGGAKVDDYLPIFNNLKNKRSKLIASGVLANLFLVAKGYNLGYENQWLQKNGYLKIIPELKKIHAKYRDQIILPIDFAIDANGRKEIMLTNQPINGKLWDLGHESVKLFKQELSKSKAIFMKGPLGYSEIPKFSYATVEILKEISKLSKNKKVFSLLGGGHLTTSTAKYNIPNNFSHISTSGGALIAYISGNKLPALEILKK